MATRTSIYSGIGVDLDNVSTVKEALEAAKLDWTVSRRNIQLCGGKKVKGWYANVRDTDEEVLGIVGESYQIVQNEEALRFVDMITRYGYQIIKAGTFRKGRNVWVLVKLHDFELVGDETENYLLIQNSFDGSGSIKICITPIRVWCQNMLALAFRKAKQSLCLKHTKNVKENIERVPEILGLAQDYTVELADYAQEMVRKTVDDFQLRSILNGLFPITEKSSDLQKKRAEENKETFMICYAAPDLARFRGTAWGVINAVADLSNHSISHKETKNYAENYLSRAVTGDALLRKVSRMVR